MYKDVGKIFKDYWDLYGGGKAFISSPYLHFSVVCTILLYKNWAFSNAWANDIISIVPSILGFSLGGYAIFFSFSDEKILSLMVNEKEEESGYLIVHAQFVHFILFQILSIFMALGGKAFVPKADLSCGEAIFSGIGFLVFSYALLSALATAFSLLRLGRMYNKQKCFEKKNN